MEREAIAIAFVAILFAGWLAYHWYGHNDQQKDLDNG
jgi:hypothetical protein